ncbi:FIG00566617: hypothetical protein [Olavius algarvensis Delta 1 endosymbiont]|nr:FIG00566617: hypothetical protein [Olavius algarvensis Delta 1 endosymbiont]
MRISDCWNRCALAIIKYYDTRVNLTRPIAECQLVKRDSGIEEFRDSGIEEFRD